MATKLKPVGHEDRLSLVEHLDELRTRIIICIAAFAISFAVCLWQDNFILNLINRPLAKAATGSCETTKDPLEQANCWQQTMRRVNADLAALALAASVQASTEPRLAGAGPRALPRPAWAPAVRPSREPRRGGLPQPLSRSAAAAEAATPRGSPKRPVTLGV